jgi:hypothetical protein
MNVWRHSYSQGISCLSANGVLKTTIFRGHFMMIGHEIVDIEFYSEMTTPPPTPTPNFIIVTNVKICLSFFFYQLVIPIDLHIELIKVSFNCVLISALSRITSQGFVCLCSKTRKKSLKTLFWQKIDFCSSGLLCFINSNTPYLILICFIKHIKITWFTENCKSGSCLFLRLNSSFRHLYIHV